jgi:hypothetical protein
MSLIRAAAWVIFVLGSQRSMLMSQELPALEGYRLGARFRDVATTIPCSSFNELDDLSKLGMTYAFPKRVPRVQKCTPADSLSLTFAEDTLRIIYVQLPERRLTTVSYWNSLKPWTRRVFGVAPDSVKSSRVSGVLFVEAFWSLPTRPWQARVELFAPETSERADGVVMIALCGQEKPGPCRD